MEQNNKIIKAIKSKEINLKNISFDLIRETGGKNYPEIHDIFSNPNYGTFGRAPIVSEKELEQYIYQYGPMIKEQWKHLFASSKLNLDCDNVEIIDYGCGQGLASMLFFDNFKQTRNTTTKLTFIEPFKIALDMAKHILQCYLTKTKIITINKKLDDVGQNEIQTDDNATKIHLFSNILDVQGFDITALFDKILLNKGLHYFLAVSHDRGFNGGSERLCDIYNPLISGKYNFKLHEKITDKFNANNKPAIFFSILIEV